MINRTLRQAEKILGVKTDADVIRLSLVRITEMEKFWRFMKKSRHTPPPGGVSEIRQVGSVASGESFKMMPSSPSPLVAMGLPWPPPISRTSSC
jgi:hypothetical protein